MQRGVDSRVLFEELVYADQDRLRWRPAPANLSYPNGLADGPSKIAHG
jgi:hypothetical protein